MFLSLGDQLSEREKSLLIQVTKNCDQQKLEAALRSQIEVLSLYALYPKLKSTLNFKLKER